MRKINILIGIIYSFTLFSCSALFNQPTKKSNARFGEEVYNSNYIKNITPVKPIVVGVYKFKDQTGQYKQVDNGVSYSTAVTQGATTILLKALEDTKWFVPIERENVSNLLNERQIIRSTRNEDNKKKGVSQNSSLPPLLFAGILLEGGIISYDSNIITGGAGARYFGAGASTQYRQDRITIYLRAVSTSNGKILKTIYVSKTILSQAIDVNLFRFVNLKRLLEVETGISQNEPGQLAVKEAIEKAVESLIVEGLKDGIWKANEQKSIVDEVITEFNKEQDIANETQLFNRRVQNHRQNSAINTSYFVTHFNGDYSNSNFAYNGFQFSYKHYFNNSKFNLGSRISSFTLDNNPVFIEDYFTADINLEYTILPKDKFTPYLFSGGGGLFKDLDHYDFKIHYGVGLEYVLNKNLGIRCFAEQNMLFIDEIDSKTYGDNNDNFWKFGIELTIFIRN